jgi:septum formation inhibitor-activating ATPase MinD
VQRLQPLVADQRLRQLRVALDDVDQVVDDPALAYLDAAARLAGEDVPMTVPGEKRGFFGKIFGRRAA